LIVIKTTVLSRFEQANQQLSFSDSHRVCQLYADEFVDLGKYQRSQIGHLVIVDGAAELSVAHDRWQEREQPFTCTFIESQMNSISLSSTSTTADASTASSTTATTTNNTSSDNNNNTSANQQLTWSEAILANSDAATAVPFDALYTTQAMENAATDEVTLGAWFDNAARLLRPGGVLFGILPDSSQLWSRAQKTLMSDSAAAGVVTGDLFELTFDRGLDELVRFGTKYALTLHDGGSGKSVTVVNLCCGSFHDTRTPPPPPPPNIYQRHSWRCKAVCSFSFADIGGVAASICIHRSDKFSRFLRYCCCQPYHDQSFVFHVCCCAEDHKRNHHASLKRCGVLNKKNALEQTDIIGFVVDKTLFFF
jgi:hypothetical protein